MGHSHIGKRGVNSNTAFTKLIRSSSFIAGNILNHAHLLTLLFGVLRRSWRISLIRLRANVMVWRSRKPCTYRLAEAFHIST